jgi:hypothetical protein
VQQCELPRLDRGLQLANQGERGGCESAPVGAKKRFHARCRKLARVELRRPIISHALAALASASSAAISMTRRNPVTKAAATAPSIDTRASGLALDGTNTAFPLGRSWPRVLVAFAKKCAHWIIKKGRKYSTKGLQCP